MREAPIFNVGNVVDKESAATITDNLVKILESRADQESIRHALSVFQSAFKIEYITIQNCNIQGDRTTTIKVDGGDVSVED